MITAATLYCCGSDVCATEFLKSMLLHEVKKVIIVDDEKVEQENIMVDSESLGRVSPKPAVTSILSTSSVTRRTSGESVPSPTSQSLLTWKSNHRLSTEMTAHAPHSTRFHASSSCSLRLVHSWRSTTGSQRTQKRTNSISSRWEQTKKRLQNLPLLLPSCCCDSGSRSR